MGAVAVIVIAPLLPYIYPPAGQTKKLDLKVTLDKALSELQNGQATKFEAPKQTGFVMKDGGGDNAPGKIAFAAYAVKDQAGQLNVFAVNCSHLGCSIAINEAAKRFDCPCHGSQFSLAGQVTHGPAAFPLSHLSWKQGANPKEVLVQGLQLPGIG